MIENALFSDVASVFSTWHFIRKNTTNDVSPSNISTHDVI